MEYPQSLDTTDSKFIEAMAYLNEAFLDERSNLIYYEYLANMAPTSTDREILYSIINDTRKHARLIRKMYTELTGIGVLHDPKQELIMPQSYLAGINEAITRKTIEIERLKIIKEVLPADLPYVNTLSDLIAAELDQITKFNSILSLNNDILNGSYMLEDYAEQDTTIFTLDDWANYTKPLVERVLLENQNIEPERLFEKLILLGIFIGLGNKPLDALELVDRWELTQTPQL